MVKFHFEVIHFHSTKYVGKYRVQNGVYYVAALMCKYNSVFGCLLQNIELIILIGTSYIN